MKRLTLALILGATLATTATAGGPVVIEDVAEAAPVREPQRKLGTLLVVAAGLLILGALANGGSDSAPCNGDTTPAPAPEPGC